jgi:hypothetical protein
MRVLEKMNGHLIIDGMDAATELGFIVADTSMESWLLYPARKEPFKHDWKDEDGIEVDLEHVYLKEKTVDLKVAFVAESEAEYWRNYDKTFEVLTAPGERTIFYRAMSREFKVYYKECTTPKRVKGPKNVSEILIKMTFQFVMPNPSVVIDRLVVPTGINLYVSDIIGQGSYSYNVLPSSASQSVRTTIIQGTGNAYVAGNTIYATRQGTVVVRVASVVDSSVYTERTITVWPSNLIRFSGDVFLMYGNEYVTEN